MNKFEHLDRIVAVCKQKLELYERLSAIESKTSRAEAGWRSTIAAIEALRWIYDHDAHHTTERAGAAINAIIAAWPKEIL